MRLSAETVRLAPDDTYPLYITAKRYWGDGATKPHGPSTHGHNGLTLVLFHATSFHKEMWEPCLETLFSLVDKSEHVRIEEAWSIESPNHGESAVLNAEALKDPPFSKEFGILGYATAAHRFLSHRSECDRNTPRRLVAIGHSGGGNVSVVIQVLTPLIPFFSVIVVEPMALPGDNDFLKELRHRLVRTVRKRRDTWASRDEARLSLPWHGKVGMRESQWWDARIVDLYVKYAMVPARGPDGEIRFTLACTRAQEEIMYLDEKGSPIVMDALDKISHKMPLHLVLGGVKDFISGDMHARLASPSPFGRRWASVTTMQGVGHLIPQERPDSLADVLSDVLSRTCPSVVYQPKL